MKDESGSYCKHLTVDIGSVVVLPPTLSLADIIGEQLGLSDAYVTKYDV